MAFGEAGSVGKILAIAVFIFQIRVLFPYNPINFSGVLCFLLGLLVWVYSNTNLCIRACVCLNVNLHPYVCAQTKLNEML